MEAALRPCIRSRNAQETGPQEHRGGHADEDCGQRCLSSTPLPERPWLVFTAGAMVSYC